MPIYRALLVLAGLGLIVTGTALVSVPAALVVAGAGLIFDAVYTRRAG